MSCLAGKEGIGMAGIGLIGGVYKEGQDLNRKLKSPKEIESYNGRWGIIKDSGKDMKNIQTSKKYNSFVKVYP